MQELESAPFFIKKDNIYAVPALHYKMELAAAVKCAIDLVKPDCIAVEMPETMQLQFMHAAARLPDLSVVVTYNATMDPLYYLAEPCDAGFEAIRSSLDKNIPLFCIDLDIDEYPEHHDELPDTYSIHKIGLQNYYKAYYDIVLKHEHSRSQLDINRELYMAKRLKELSLSYDRILFVGGMYHIQQILDQIDRPAFPTLNHAQREVAHVCTLTEESAREVMSECGFISKTYEETRKNLSPETFPPDRQKILYKLFKEASEIYIANSGDSFPGYNMRNIMKFCRNYSIITGRLMPTLYQFITSAKACAGHTYAYEVWELATEWPYLKNVDNLDELDLSVEDVWGAGRDIKFHLKEKSRKTFMQELRHKKGRPDFRFQPPGPFSICSYPKEDVIIEKFGEFLKKKGTQILSEEGARTIPFSSSLEDGIDTRETIRHWSEKKLYIKVKGKPPGGVGSVVMIFDEDKPSGDDEYHEKYPWKTSWLGEHSQESDMAFFATPMRDNVVGPGISRCEYGGFMMTYPPRRLIDVWTDPDYFECRSKAEVLLMSAIDYSVEPLITYVAPSPPRQALKSFARRYGKKVIYIPLGQLSPITLSKIRVFHVLDGHNRRSIADEYIN